MCARHHNRLGESVAKAHWQDHPLIARNNCLSRSNLRLQDQMTAAGDDSVTHQARSGEDHAKASWRTRAGAMGSRVTASFRC